MQDRIDISFMRCAFELAQKGLGHTNPNPAVGAVVVRDGEIVGSGYHPACGMPHAEVYALKAAGSKAAGATLYVTLEPCSTYGRTPPCTEAIIAAGIKRVVAATSDCFKAHAGNGFRILEAAGIPCTVGVLAEECSALNKSFFKWAASGRPYVVLKMAMTLDGRIACRNGASKWITGSAARHRVQYLRSLADAVMVAGNTLRTDHPRLDVRDIPGFKRTLRRYVATESMTTDEVRAFFPEGAAAEAVRIDPAGEWLDCMGREKITNLLVEGGGELAALLVKNRQVDEIEFHIAPKLLCGKGSRPVTGGDDPESLSEAVGLQNVTVEMLEDGTLVYRGIPS